MNASFSLPTGVPAGESISNDGAPSGAQACRQNMNNLRSARWLWIQPRSIADIQSIRRLLSITRQPRNAKADQP